MQEKMRQITLTTISVARAPSCCMIPMVDGTRQSPATTVPLQLQRDATKSFRKPALRLSVLFVGLKTVTWVRDTTFFTEEQPKSSSASTLWSIHAS